MWASSSWIVTTTDCASGCDSRSAATTSTPEPSGRPRSISAMSNLTAVISSRASCTRAASEISEFGKTCSTSCFSQVRISGRSSSSRMLVMGRLHRYVETIVAAQRPRWGINLQRQREPYHGAVPWAGLHQALALQLLGAVFHARHAVAAVELAVQLHRYALAVVLDQQPEVALADRRAELAVRGAAVLDDVADRLAQDARRLHVRACRQQVLDLLGRPFPVALDVGLAEPQHGLGAPVGERVGQAHRLAREAAHRQPHFLQRLARER